MTRAARRALIQACVTHIDVHPARRGAWQPDRIRPSWIDDFINRRVQRVGSALNGVREFSQEPAEESLEGRSGYRPSWASSEPSGSL